MNPKPRANLLVVVALLLASCAVPAETATSSVQTTVPSSTNTTSTTTTTLPTGTTTPIESTTIAPSTTTTFEGEVNILFVGNSETSTHDIPRTVRELLDSDPLRSTTTQLMSASFLSSASSDPAIIEAISSGEWDVVVLQGQEISPSHSIIYSQDEGIALAQLAIESGARPLFFAEGSRSGIDETEYIEGIYDEMAAKSGAEVIPAGRSWDLFQTELPEAEYPLRSADGTPDSNGAFLAAATIAYFIAGPEAPLTTDTAHEHFLRTARETIESYLSS